MASMAPLQNYYQSPLVEAGCDEAGRGCYAGPVFAAAVILPKDFFHPLLNDSKKVNAATRSALRKQIESSALAYCVAYLDVEEIDALNILRASQKAMHLALDGLTLRPQFVSVDGNYFVPYKNIPHQCIVRGDAKFAHIAAASILAKTYRDAYMQQLHLLFPQYNWQKNKGYGTAEHRKAIEEHGLSQHHRKIFNIAPAQLRVF